MRKRFALGGIAQSNLEQMQNSVVSIKHHVVELGARLKSNPEIPAWVLSKTYRASEYLADITHYLESEMTGKKYCWGGKMADGGSIAAQNLAMEKNITEAIKHHVVELEGMMDKKPEVEGWVIGKLTVAAKDLMDVTHYLEGEAKTFAVDGQNKQYARGGNVTPKEKMIKELQKLQRDLNSSRLSQYREGDTSEEEMARQRERASKLARFNEILKELDDDDNKMADGGVTIYKEEDLNRRDGKLKKTQVTTVENYREALERIKELESKNKNPNIKYYTAYIYREKGGYMAKGGETKPSLIPDYKKISNVDDARFEERGKMAKGGKVRKKYWIQDALSGDHKGALRETAKRKHLIKGDENLSKADLHKLEKMGGKTARRAYMAETLRKFK